MRILMNISLVSLLVLSYPLISLAQEGDQPTDNQSSDTSTENQSQAILLSITQSPPDQNAQVQQYHINSGDTAFVQLVATGTPPNPNSPPQVQYQQQMGDVSNQIVQKIAELNQKQQQLNQEIYPTQRPIVQGQITVIQNELQSLQLRRTQLESQQTATVASQITNPPTSGSVTVAHGINLKPELSEDNKVTITVIPQGENANQTQTETTLGNWIRVYSPEGGGAQGVWAKVDFDKSRQ